jgi:hypothetical protein
MPTSRMPNPRDYPDPIGYAVASADWRRAQVHVIHTTHKVFSAASPPSPASATASSSHAADGDHPTPPRSMDKHPVSTGADE